MEVQKLMDEVKEAEKELLKDRTVYKKNCGCIETRDKDKPIKLWLCQKCRIKLLDSMKKQRGTIREGLIYNRINRLAFSLGMENKTPNEVFDIIMDIVDVVWFHDYMQSIRIRLGKLENNRRLRVGEGND